MESNTCGTCPEGSEWSVADKACENKNHVAVNPETDGNETNATDANATEENMTMVSNPSAADRAYGEIPEAADNATVCDEATPFFNGE